MDQFAYLFGQRPHGPWEDQVPALQIRVPVVMAAPLDADAVVSDVLLQRARRLSRQPAHEAVVLVAHGPVADAHNAQCLTVMGRLAERLQQEGGFRGVVPTTLRDDAPAPVRAAAVEKIRQVVGALGQEGDVLVLPLLLAQGGVEHKLPQELAGLTYRYSGETLLPHPGFAEWLRTRVLSAAP